MHVYLWCKKRETSIDKVLIHWITILFALEIYQYIQRVPQKNVDATQDEYNIKITALYCLYQLDEILCDTVR